MEYNMIIKLTEDRKEYLISYDCLFNPYLNEDGFWYIELPNDFNLPEDYIWLLDYKIN